MFVLGEASVRGVIRLGLSYGKWAPVEGRRHGDLLGTEEVDIHFLSERMLAAMAPLTGWKRGATAAVRDANGQLSRYRGLIVTGRAGAPRVSRASVEFVDGGLASVKGLEVDPGTWDGCDVFRPDGTDFVVVSDRAAALLRDMNLVNVHLEDIEKLMRTVPVEHVDQ